MIDTTLPTVMPFVFEDRLFRAVEAGPAAAWVASDVASILGYRDAFNLTRGLDDDEKGTRIVSTLGGSQELTVISESGLWHAIFNSRRPEAKRLRRFVTEEVLPKLRRDGFYAMPGAQPPSQPAPIEQRIPSRRATFSTFDRLKRTTNPAERRWLYAMLAQDNLQLQLPLPAIDEIGRDAPQPSELLTPFFEGLDQLTTLGATWDHARGAIDSACSPREVGALFDQHEIDVRIDAALQAAARAIGSGIEKKTVNSVLTGHPKHCWVFPSRKAA